jgi:hypothetical protein
MNIFCRCDQRLEHITKLLEGIDRRQRYLLAGKPKARKPRDNKYKPNGTIRPDLNMRPLDLKEGQGR